MLTGISVTVFTRTRPPLDPVLSHLNPVPSCPPDFCKMRLNIILHRLLHTHHLSSVAGTIGQLVADVPSGLSLTPPQETKKKCLYLCPAL
jgi:hypothetical protein